MSFTPKILWDPHGILPPLSFFLLPPSLSPLSFPPSAFLFTLARAAAVVAVGTTVGNGGAVATVGRRRRSSDERASSPTGATVGTRLSPRESSVSSDPCRLSRSIERVSIIRAPCPSPSRRPAAVFAVGTLSLPREHRRRQPPRSSLRQPPPPSCLLPPPPAAAVLSASLLPIRCLRAPLLPTRATARLWFSSSVAGPSSWLLGGREERVR